MQTRLFVRDFPRETDISSLEELFSNIGNVEKATLEDILTNGVTRRVAYIEMSTPEEALNCIHRFHGVTTDGFTLTVTEDKPHVPSADFRPLKSKANKKRKQVRRK